MFQLAIVAAFFLMSVGAYPQPDEGKAVWEIERILDCAYWFANNFGFSFWKAKKFKLKFDMNRRFPKKS